MSLGGRNVRVRKWCEAGAEELPLLERNVGLEARKARNRLSPRTSKRNAALLTP